MTTVPPRQHHDERMLLREITHRVHQEFISSVNIVSAAAVRTRNSEVKVALSQVAELLEQHADTNRVLAFPECEGLVDSAEYVRRLAFAFSRSTLEPMAIRLAVVADSLPLESERCWRVALAVHELVTNAARHACFDDRDGDIKIKLSLTEQTVNCIVADNGSLSTRLKPGRGLKMVSDLASSLGGRIEYGFGAKFSSFLVVFPLTERERRANRSVKSRNARATRAKAPSRRDMENAWEPT